MKRDPRPVPHLAQKLLDDVIVRLRPVRTTPHLPKVDDVADQIDHIGIVVSEEIKKSCRLRGARPKVHIRQEDRPMTTSRTGCRKVGVMYVLHEPTQYDSCFSLVTTPRFVGWSQLRGFCSGVSFRIPKELALTVNAKEGVGRSRHSSLRQV